MRYHLHDIINHKKAMSKTVEERLTDLETLLNEARTSNQQFADSVTNGLEKIDKNFDAIHNHFNQIYERLTNLDTKIDSLSGSTDQHLEKVNLNLVSIKDEISKIRTVTRYDEEHTNLKIVNKD